MNYTELKKWNIPSKDLNPIIKRIDIQLADIWIDNFVTDSQKFGISLAGEKLRQRMQDWIDTNMPGKTLNQYKILNPTEAEELNVEAGLYVVLVKK